MTLASASAPGSMVTASFGVAVTIPAGDMTQEALVQAADRALYRAKNEGRNRVAADELKT